MECRDENNLRLLRSTAGFLQKLQRFCCRAAILVSGRLLLPRIYAFTVVDAHSILHDFFSFDLELHFSCRVQLM